MPQLPSDRNPYSGTTPFEVLGVSPSATSRDILRARDEKLEDIDYTFQGEQRILERAKLMAAYEQLSDARTRLAVEFFSFDSTVGQKEVHDTSEQLLAAKIDVGGVLQSAEDVLPSTPYVAHAATSGRGVRFRTSLNLETAKTPFPKTTTADVQSVIAFEC